MFCFFFFFSLSLACVGFACTLIFRGCVREGGAFKCISICSSQLLVFVLLLCGCFVEGWLLRSLYILPSLLYCTHLTTAVFLVRWTGLQLYTSAIGNYLHHGGRFYCGVGSFCTLLMSEQDPQMNWQDSNDVLQGIMVGHDGLQPQSDLLDFKQSALTLDDPASNPLLELHLPDFASLETQSQPIFSNQWSSSSEPQKFYYPNYSSSRLASDQDAWSPLQVTGVPNSSTVSHMNISAMGDPDCGFVKPHYSTPSESGSQYMGSFHSADSGYGTHSVVTSSYGVDSMSSPQIAAQEHGFGETLAVFDRSHVGTGPFFDYSSSYSLDTAVKCDHPTCSWVGKCPSDKRYITFRSTLSPWNRH